MSVFLEKFENFLKSKLYIAIVMVYVFLSWHIKAGPSISGMSFANAIGVIGITFMWSIVALLYKDAQYGLPLVLSFCYMLSSSDLNLKTLSEMVPILVAAIFFLIGVFGHIIRFRRKIKWGSLSLGLLLMAIASFMPFLYVDITFPLIVLSLVGVLHFLVYMYFDNYSKIDLQYFFWILYGLSWLLFFQLISRYTGYLLKHGVNSYPNGIRDSWSGFNNFGWGVINDVFIHLLMLLPVHIYYIIKKPNKFIYWAGALIIIFSFIVSGSRGGVMGLIISIPFYVYFILKYSNRQGRINLAIIGIITLGFFIAGYNVVEAIINGLKKSLEGDGSTGRFTLWKQGWETFKMYPIFGGGWGSRIMTWGSDTRVVVYHSTIIHTLAIMGIFGMIAVIINWYESLKILVRKINLEKWIILVGFISSQAYGMIDITQHAAFYMIIIIVQIMAIDKSKPKTKKVLDIEEYKLKPLTNLELSHN